MKFFSFLMFLCFSFSVQAQFESSKKPLSFSLKPKKNAPKVVPLPKETDPNKPQAIPFESKFLKNPKDKLLDNALSNPKVELGAKPQYELKNPAELFEDRYNKKDGNIEERYKSDTFLGQFKSNSKTIRVACRDHEAPDGDRVRIWNNDRIVVDDIELESDYKEVFLDLEVGFNKIEFEALNQGLSGPNTAQFTVFDDKGAVITNNKWNLTTGVKAKIIVVKEDKK
ncbi:MAG: hypothetical protein H7239_07520 [Flavobacterium sp.]|nr:hypothetical protein [Flavobacterium sp.]